MSEVLESANYQVEQPALFELEAPEVTPAERLEHSIGSTAEFIREVLAAQQQPAETLRQDIDVQNLVVPHAQVLSSVGALASAARLRLK